VEGTAHAMAWALDMPAVEREARLAQLRARVNSWTATQWLDAQLEALGIDQPTPAARKDNKPRSPKNLENIAA
jgi:trehalose-6-phosphate synthase